MEIEQLDVPGAWLVRPRLHRDDRGSLREWLRQDVVRRAVGREVAVEQANCSVSRRGVLRGIHVTDVPPGQAKYVTCPSGAVLDVVVDLRVGSPTFGRHAAVRLDGVEGACLLVEEGLGHAFCALSDEAVVLYLCSTAWAPDRDRTVHALDPALALPWPADLELVLSEKDRTAPSLAEAVASGALPSYADCAALSGR